MVTSEPLKLVLLGGTGLVGSGILRFLAQNAPSTTRVHMLVRKKSQNPPPPFVTECVGSLEQLPPELFPQEPHVVIHFALKNIDRDGTGFTSVNITGTQALLQQLPSACLGIIYGGSLSDYGQGDQNKIDENTPLRPVTALAKSRVVAEGMIFDAMQRRGKSAYILRPRLIVHDNEMTLHRLIKMLGFGIALGSGEQKISIIDVADYANVIIQLSRDIVARDAAHTPACNALNVGYLEPLSFTQIEDIISKILDIKNSRLRIPASDSLVKLLNLTGRRKAIGIASWIDLIGFTHYADVAKLEALIGSTLLNKNPRAVFKNIVDALASE